jgi:hypothetical protein
MVGVIARRGGFDLARAVALPSRVSMSFIRWISDVKQRPECLCRARSRQSVGAKLADVNKSNDKSINIYFLTSLLQWHLSHAM